MQYLKDVTTLNFNANKCTGCGCCQEVCPHGVFKVNRSTAVVTNTNSCMECGACAKNCPRGAIEVNPGVGCAAAVLKSWIKI